MDKNVWILDIETSPLIVMAWRLGKQYLTPDSVLEDWYIMSFSAKRLNASPNKLIYMEAKDKNDLPLLKKLWEIFNEADVIITQNGKRFDEPKIKARMMLAGLTPYKPFEHYDTFLENNDKEFTSHSLAYLTDKFCKKYKKLKHKQFPGLSLWKECRKGNPKAWEEMRKYNNYDVLSTEELYLNTRGWSTKKAPSVYTGDPERRCGNCGAYKLEKRGFEMTTKKRYQRMHCRGCGKWKRGLEVK